MIRLWFPDQQAASWTGVQLLIEQHLFGSAPNFNKSLSTKQYQDYPQLAAQNKGVWPELFVSSTDAALKRRDVNIHTEEVI